MTDDSPQVHPRTEESEQRHMHAADWWRTAVIYQVYPRSFADASGDGIGDMQGIASRLDYLADLGVDAIWLSPFMRSPQRDHGYDIADYREVDPIFGTLADFDLVMRGAHERGMRVIIDIVPNHSSDQHAAFKAAVAGGPGSPERGRYIFRDGRGATGELPPNNWIHGVEPTPWTRITEADGQPGQWYLHIFDVSQPDFNWDDPWVREEFRSILSFWLDRGVDGFRIDVAHGLVKQAGLPDFDFTWTGQIIPTVDPLTRPPQWDQDEVHEIYRDWRRLLESYGPDRILVAEAWLETQRLVRYVRPDEMHQAFNFRFATTAWEAGALRAVIDLSIAGDSSVSAPTTWVLSNHDMIRHASRLGFPRDRVLPGGIGADDDQPERELGLLRARAFSLLMLGLPGSAYLYQGEELGLPEATELPDEAREDYIWVASKGLHRGRDGCRVPLPWTHDAPAFGFSETGAAWLPQPGLYAEYSMDLQRGRASSTLEMYRLAIGLQDRTHTQRGYESGSCGSAGAWSAIHARRCNSSCWAKPSSEFRQCAVTWSTGWGCTSTSSTPELTRPSSASRNDKQRREAAGGHIYGEMCDGLRSAVEDEGRSHGALVLTTWAGVRRVRSSSRFLIAANDSLGNGSPVSRWATAATTT